MLEENLPKKHKICKSQFDYQRKSRLVLWLFRGTDQNPKSPILTGYFSEVLRSFSQIQGECYKF